MTETRQTGIGKQYSPAGRKIRIASLATAQAPDPIDKGHYGGGHNRHTKKRVGEAAVVVEGEGRASETAEYVEVGGFGGKRESERSERGLAIESGAARLAPKRKWVMGSKVWKV